MTIPARSLCICVDDYGLHEGINQAAIDLAQLGRVHAISCMTAGSAWAVQAQRLVPLAAGGVDIGLHLDFTEQLPEQAMRWPLGQLIRGSLLRQLDRVAIRQEIKRQLDVFEQAFGAAPTYVDGHQHVHQLPGIREELLAVLGQRYPHKLPWLRSTRSQGLAWAQWRAGLLSVIKPWGIELLGQHGLSALAKAQGYKQNQRLLGVYDFTGGAQRYAQLLEQWLASAGSGDLLMCHPSAPTTASDNLLSARQAEFSVLAGSQLDQLLSRHGVELRAVSQMALGN
jgi:chitin disaccharide deacetylase